MAFFGIFKRNKDKRHEHPGPDEETRELQAQTRRRNAKLRELEDSIRELELQYELEERRQDLAELRGEEEEGQGDLLSGLGLGPQEILLANILSGGKLTNLLTKNGLGSVEASPLAPTNNPPTPTTSRVKEILSTLPRPLILQAQQLKEADLKALISEKYPDLSEEEVLLGIQEIKSFK